MKSHVLLYTSALLTGKEMMKIIVRIMYVYDANCVYIYYCMSITHTLACVYVFILNDE